MKTILQLKKLLIFALLFLLGNFCLGQTNDYPWPNAACSGGSTYGMVYKNCTDWVAWKINQNQDNQPVNTPHAFFNDMYSSAGDGTVCNPTSALQRLSNACRWDNVLQNNGYFVSTTPTPGAIAHWNNNEGNGVGSAGHVAYVEYVQSNGIPFLSHYNWNPSCAYATTNNINAPRYIRFNRFELIGTPSIQPIYQGNPFNMTANIKNNHSITVTTQIRATLYTTTNQFVGVLEEKTETFTAGQTKNISFYKNTILSSPGDYKIFIETRVNSSTPFTLVHKFQQSSTQSVVINSAINNCSITLNTTTGGTVTGSGSFTCGTSRTVTATANSGYAFTNWTDGGTIVSTNPSYTFTLNSDKTLTANFMPTTTINIIGSLNAEVFPTSEGQHILRCNQLKNIFFSIRNITNSSVTRSFKLYLTDMSGNFVAELWNAENLSFTAGETKSFDRNTNISLGTAVISPAGNYKIILKGDIGTLTNITLNSPTVVCNSGACNPQNIQIVCGNLGVNNDETKLNGIAVYPNPTNDFLNIETTDSSIFNLILFDLQGRKINEHKANSTTCKLNLQNLQSAVYLLQIETEKETQIIKVVKK